ncbi:MAG: alpha-amylase family glycosyl hydrolase [Candidatus Limnocylindria bacterium]
MRFLPAARRQRLMVGAAGVALLVIAGALLLPRLGPGPNVISLDPDLPPLSADGKISVEDLAHDSRNDLYRTPYGAAPAGTVVILRLRAAAGDLTEASVRIYDTRAQGQVIIPMAVAARDTTGGRHGYDYWQVEIPTIRLPTVLYYRFVVRDGTATRYVEDDAALDGGPGQVLEKSADQSWQIDTYEPDFTTPAWAAGATVYQVFPDRFANGNPANDPSPSAVPGTAGADRYRFGDVYGNPILVKAWNQLPEGYCRAYKGAATPCTEGPLGRDFYGGDLAGLTQHIGDLAGLGVTVIYLNPIFAAPSNHRYDTSDYGAIDPDLGTQEEFDAFVTAAHGAGMKVVLDGVFNHTSSDSPFFDRSHRYAEIGACEAADSPWANWYTLQPGPPAKCFDGQTYVDWFGFDTLAVLTEDPAVFAYFNGPDGIVRKWLKAGIDGWRLDVMNELGTDFLRGLRNAVHLENPNALVLGEEWNDSSPWLLGDQADGVMNYRFRRAVIGLINGDTADPDGSIAGLTPSTFAATMEGVREDYPAPAWNALLNLVDSHDTARILWTLTPGEDNRAAKEAAAALAQGKAKLRQVAALQLTWPGMASIYYGDEVGLTGHDDPDDRRPYPWGSEDQSLRAYYQQLANLRRDHEALRTGDLTFLLADDTANVLAFGRRTDGEASVTVLNLSDQQRELSIDVSGWLPDGTELAQLDPQNIGKATVQAGHLSLVLGPRGAEVLLTEAGADLAPPAAPSGLTASADAGKVTLGWQPVADAAGYTVWRSIVAGGGYEQVGEATSTTSFVDGKARSGTRYHYVVVAQDAAGNASARSAEVEALPQLVVADARLEGPAAVTQPLSAVEAGVTIAARVRVDGYSAADGATIGIVAQLGIGPVGTSPAATEGNAWTWSAMTYERDVDGADRFVGTVRPETVGSWSVALRVSTDAGATWQLSDRDGIGFTSVQAVSLEATAPSDAEPPAAPGGARAAVVSDAAVVLAWEPVSASDLFRYEVRRSDVAGGPYETVGLSTEPTFADGTVHAGGTYYYVVVAQDTSYNRSPSSNEVVAAAASRQVAVTFTVHAPANTPPGDTLYIAGDFQNWDPGATPMTRVDALAWTITLPFTENAAPQYKFTRGSWDAVEKDAGCGEIPNRSTTATYGTDGTQAVDQKVDKWRDVDQCG